MIKAVIFDMDGTMVNTHILWGLVNRKLMAKYGYEFNESLRIKMMGKKDAEALAIIRDYYQLPVDVSVLVNERRKILLEDSSSVKINNGLFQLLDLLENSGITKAVATSAYKEFAMKILSELRLASRFTVIVTGDDVVISKPDPAIFLKTADQLGVVPEECLVIEDAENGVEAAYRAGMHVFAIPNTASTHHNFSHATKILQSMEDITLQLLQNLSPFTKNL